MVGGAWEIGGGAWARWIRRSGALPGDAGVHATAHKGTRGDRWRGDWARVRRELGGLGLERPVGL